MSRYLKLIYFNMIVFFISNLHFLVSLNDSSILFSFNIFSFNTIFDLFFFPTFFASCDKHCLVQQMSTFLKRFPFLKLFLSWYLLQVSHFLIDRFSYIPFFLLVSYYFYLSNIIISKRRFSFALTVNHQKPAMIFLSIRFCFVSFFLQWKFLIADLKNGRVH